MSRLRPRSVTWSPNTLRHGRIRTIPRSCRNVRRWPPRSNTRRWRGRVSNALEAEAFTHPAYAVLRTLIAEAGGTAAGLGGAEWVNAVADRTDDLTVRAMLSELANEPLPVKTEADIPRFVAGVLARTQEAWVGRQIAELKSKLQRVSSTEQPDAYFALFGDLVALEQYRKSLLTQAMGNHGDFATGA
ncbi:hypothetical protein ACRS5S_12270 [Nocardia asiatica]|uniref:hypothetical protein n=1 Tax=Nocardia asiatica TaxID=209252 RepID=UPI003EE2112F